MQREIDDLPFRTIEDFCYTHNLVTKWDMVDYQESIEGDVRMYKCRDCTQRKLVRLDSERNYRENQLRFLEDLKDE